MAQASTKKKKTTKSAASKTSAKKASQSKATPKKTKVKAIKEKQTRVEILQYLSDKTGLKRIEVESVFQELTTLIHAHMQKSGSGEITIPMTGVKLCRKRRKATKARQMVSPLTGTEVTIPAKPARNDIKVIVLKTLKEAVAG
jgi:nucleoid DNA-binding protein